MVEPGETEPAVECSHERTLGMRCERLAIEPLDFNLGSYSTEPTEDLRRKCCRSVLIRRSCSILAASPVGGETRVFGASSALCLKASLFNFRKWFDWAEGEKSSDIGNPYSGSSVWSRMSGVREEVGRASGAHQYMIGTGRAELGNIPNCDCCSCVFVRVSCCCPSSMSSIPISDASRVLSNFATVRGRFYLCHNRYPYGDCIRRGSCVPGLLLH